MGSYSSKLLEPMLRSVAVGKLEVRDPNFPLVCIAVPVTNVRWTESIYFETMIS